MGITEWIEDLNLLHRILDGAARAEQVLVAEGCQVSFYQGKYAGGDSPSSTRVTDGQNFFSSRYGSG